MNSEIAARLHLTLRCAERGRLLWQIETTQRITNETMGAETNSGEDFLKSEATIHQ
jgi:hypothetical protein